MRHATLLRTFAITACALCLGVVVLGAYVRLSAAGLGCPDWPGCYGHLSPAHLTAATVAAPIDLGKAWREMLHRYAAGSLGLLILCLAGMTLAWRRERVASGPLVSALLGIVLVQGLFGMLTVTWRLNPLIVTLHLLFGLTTLSLLWWLVQELISRPEPGTTSFALPLARLALGALCMQIALGGWTSSNYAAIACPDLPTCQGSWWPSADFHHGYALWRAGSGLDTAARVAIHLTHRLGAVLAAAALLAAALAALRLRERPALRHAALAALGLLLLQLCLGVSMVWRGFPLWLATAHNAGAALLLLATLRLNFLLRPSVASEARDARRATSTAVFGT